MLMQQIPAPEEAAKTLPRPAREPVIDWLRGFAALAVVVFHLNEVHRGGSDIYAQVVRWGSLGVPVFFVLSGYCVMLASRDHPAALDYFGRRLMRVIPPFWASLCLVAVIVGWRIAMIGNNDITALPKSLWAVVATVFLLTDPVTDLPTVNWVYWTLSYELAFYLVLYPIVRAKRAQGALLVFVTMLALMIPEQHVQFRALFFLNKWPLFASGAALALMLDRPGRTHGLALAATLGLAAMVLTATDSLAGGSTVLAIAAGRWLRLSDTTPITAALSWLGAISYSLYLNHVPIGAYFLGHIANISTPRAALPRIAIDLAITAGCILFAAGFHRMVERPSHRLSRRLFSRKYKPDPAAMMAV